MTSSAAGPVTVVEQDGIARVCLNAPPQNRMSLQMMRALSATFGELAQREGLRAVVVQATGPTFCAGADLRDAGLAELMTQGEAGRIEVAALGELLVHQLAQLPVPTVVAARGHVVGAGACLFTVADFRVCAPDVTVSFPEVDRGMHLGWRILPRLFREFGAHRTRRLTLLGEALSAQELAPAFATLAQDPEAEGLALATSLAARAPLAVRSITRVFRQLDVESLALADGDAAAFASTVGSEDFAEAMAAFFEHRAPRFHGR